MSVSDRLSSAKRPRSIIAGPYGHPFHPIAITIPIGAWTASLVFDILGLFAEDARPFVIGAFVLVIIGLVGAAAAAVLGFLDYSVIPPDSAAKRTALVHMVLNLAVMALFVVGAVIRGMDDAKDEVPIAAMIIGMVALLALGLSGWLGGKLSYHYGVRVADEKTQREGFER